MTETSKEELQKLEAKIDRKLEILEKNLIFLPLPFSKLSMMALQKGGTGASILRKIPIDVFWNTSADEQQKLDTHGSFTDILHLDFASSGTTTRHARTVIVPSDCISIGEQSLNFLWLTSSASGNVEMNITVRNFNENSATTGEVLIYDGTPVTIAAPTIGIDNLVKVTLKLTTLFSAGDYIAVFMERIADDGNDTCTGSIIMYATWLEYVAFI